jgi:acetyl esterase/lipase
LGAKLNLGSELENFRAITRYISNGVRQDHTEDENIFMVDRPINGVNSRIYTLKNTQATKSKSVMIYYHGGAYCIGDVSTYDLYLSEFVKQLDLVVISVDYRMAPEFAYPTPTDDCYSVTKYVIQNPHEFNADLTRLILAGDSAGGNAAAVISQRLLAEKLQKPRLQVLIYPWVQIFNFMLPSVIQYSNVGMLAQMLSNARVTSWYLGIQNVTAELDSSINTNDHAALISDPVLREKIKSYYNIENIPAEFRRGKSYYETHPTFLGMMYPEYLGGTHILRNDARMASLFRKLHDPSISPLLADDEKLTGLPKAYFIVLEKDALKDEGLLYAERLKKAGVYVKMNFYENGLHGMVPLIHKRFGYQLSREMQADLVKYIRENI